MVEKTGVSIVVCPPATELARIAGSVHIPVFAQHVDDKGEGSFTGWISVDAVAAAGASGTLLNHSERKMPFDVLERSLKRCKESGLEVIVCADDLAEAEKVAALRPDYVAVEPPELIGGNISVTSARPEIVSESVARIKAVERSVEVLCGAGVKKGRDVRKALELGTVGVLVASGAVKAKNQRKVLEDLVSNL